MPADYEVLTDRMLAGDKAALAKLITIVESRAPETLWLMSRLGGKSGQAHLIGVTGPPGAGKSTLLDRLIASYRAARHEIGIIAVDPSSPFSGGAVLADRIRMQSHSLDEGVFIRSLSARGSVGGLTRAARHVARLLEAFGKDIIIVETVGVGQNESDVMRLADTVVVVVVPEAGDTIQAMKAGLLEIADIFVVNKADREGAMRLKAELEAMLQLRPASAWSVPVLTTVATDGKGMDALVSAMGEHRKFLQEGGEGRARAAAGRYEEFLSTVRDELASRVERSLSDGRWKPLFRQVRQGEVDPYEAALRVISDEKFVQSLVKSSRAR
jgi:LAO/AO transport system kinase